MRALATLSILALLPGVVHAATTVTASSSETQTFLGGRSGKLVYIDKNDSDKTYWIDLDDMSVHKLSDDTNCGSPLLSADGTRVIYEQSANAYIRPLAGGARTHVGGSSVGGKDAYAPHWWTDPGSGDEYVIYMDYSVKDKQDGTGHATWKQKLVADEPSGTKIKILDHAFDGGLSKDGTTIGEAYHYCHMAKTTDLGGGDGWDITARLDGGNQCCNASMSPDNNYYLMHLRIDHEGTSVEDWNDNRIVTIWKPSGSVEMQNPEYSTDPGYSTFTAQFGSSYYIYIADTSSGDSLKIAEGDFGVPHLWVAPVAPSEPTLGLSPGTLTFSAGEGGSDPATQDVTVSNTGAGTLDTVSASEGASWLSIAVSGSGNSQTLTVSATVSGLTAGTYNETVQVSCANATNSPRTFDVTFTVTSPPQLTTIEVTPTSTNIEPGQTVDLAASAKDQSGNPFAATLAWSVSGGGSMSPTDSGGPVTSHNSTFTSDGTEGSFTVTASSGGVNDSAAISVSVTPPLDLKVACGENAHDGSWESDDAYVTGGGDWTNPEVVSVTDVPGAAPAALYRTVRHNSPTFDIPAASDGPYAVRLHFADAYANPRHIDVDIEGVRVLSDYDITSDAGGVNRAAVRVFGVTVSDGDGMTIALSSTDGDSFAAGFEIVAGGDAVAPALSIVTPADAANVAGAMLVDGTASDNAGLARVEVRVDDGAFNVATGLGSWSFTVDTASLTDGAHTVTARAIDDFGNRTTDTIGIEVDNSVSPGPSISLSAPNGGEVWEVGTTQLIAWTTVELGDVALSYSADNGVSWTVIESSVDTTRTEWGSYPWVVPDTISTETLVRIAGYFGEAPTQSATTFEIRAAGTPGPTDPADPADPAVLDDLVLVGSASCAATGHSSLVGLLLLAVFVGVRRRRSRS